MLLDLFEQKFPDTGRKQMSVLQCAQYCVLLELLRGGGGGGGGATYQYFR